MSCTIEWEKLIDAAKKARDDSVGANIIINESNLLTVADLLYDIARRTGLTDELTERIGG